MHIQIHKIMMSIITNVYVAILCLEGISYTELEITVRH